MEFGSLLAKGGPVVYILLALSVYVLSIVIYKIHVLSKVNFFRFDVTQDSLAMWLDNKKEDAYKAISKDIHPQKEVVSFTMYHLLKNNITQAKERYLREEVLRLSQERLEYYDSNLDTLKVIAMVAPLLGLLGTVFGMIDNSTHELSAAAFVKLFQPPIIIGPRCKKSCNQHKRHNH